MDFNAIFKRVIAIITKPKDEWVVIKNENITVADMFVKYAVFLAAIPAVAGFLGNLLVGRSIMGITIRIPFARSLVWGVTMYVMMLLGVFVLGFIIDTLAPSFGAQKDMVGSMKVAVYASTASWAAGVLYLIPPLSILAVVAGFYSLYLLYLGIQTVKNPAPDKASVYLVAVIIVQIVVSFLVGFIVGMVAFGRAAAYM